jgi:hypothetical protein
MRNKHGLDRKVSAEIRRKIRQNSKFSCVICRSPICTYEHFDPEFKDATEHNPYGMCLLCHSCQMDTTAGRLSKAVINQRVNARKAEHQVESRKDNFLFFDQMPMVKLGNSIITRADTIICTDEVDCLSFSRDPETGTFLMNMVVFDLSGREIARISENTWTSSYRPWDFEFKGKVITFRSKPGSIIFRAVLNSGANMVEITHLDMTIGRSRVRLDDGLVVATRSSLDKTRVAEISAEFNLASTRAAVFLDNREDVPRYASTVSTLNKPFGGITLGRGANGLVYFFSAKLRGIGSIPPDPTPMRTGPREAFVEGMLLIRHVKFPFWTEKEYILNGVFLEGEPQSVDDVGRDEHGGKIELFHVGPQDAHKFDISNGLVANQESELAKPPKRPHRFQ